jgi:hypothetical protein
MIGLDQDHFNKWNPYKITVQPMDDHNQIFVRLENIRDLFDEMGTPTLLATC